ncbi:MAG: T9SS type A sorting domain-containing protein [Bacteroidales bacterium]|nr:T9SS type A sorting domain-containing protein [Bacteroidales bacterium]
MQLLGTVSGNFTSYTDLNAQPGVVYYMVEVINPNDCNPEGLKSGKYNSSISNIATNNSLGIDNKLQLTSLTAYPNPATDKIKVISGDFQKENFVLSVVNSMGSVVFIREISGSELSNGYELATDDLSPGLYTIQATGSESAGAVRFIRKK